MSENKPQVKLDFIGVSPKFGIVPVTNVALLVDRRDFERGRAQASFAHQEVVVCTKAPPRSLLLIEEFARYLLWLRADAACWLRRDHKVDNKAPLKGLKRCLSLLMLIGDDLPTEAIPSLAGALPDVGAPFNAADLILSSLNEGTLARVADDLRVAELRRMAPLGHGLVPDDVLRSIHQGERLANDVIDAALDAAETLAKSITYFIDEYFDSVGAGLR